MSYLLQMVGNINYLFISVTWLVTMLVAGRPNRVWVHAAETLLH